MKTKISVAIISILFMMACGTAEQPKEAEAPQSNKMILKASNNMYVAASGDTALIANQQDATKAEIFEKVDKGNGKFALKASTGKFVSDERKKNNVLVVNRDAAGEWEQFEIITLDGGKINLKSSAGKIVCGDQSIGGRLIANRDQAGEWEAFIVEPK